MDATSSPLFAPQPRRAVPMNSGQLPPPWSPSPPLGRSTLSTPRSNRLDEILPLADEQGANGAPPAYSNSLRLATLCQRKKEFKSAYEKVHRGQRGWETVWLVLDGTLLRVYAPTREERKALEERYVSTKLNPTGRSSPSPHVNDNRTSRPAQLSSSSSPSNHLQLHRAHTVHASSSLRAPGLTVTSTRESQGDVRPSSHRRTTSIAKASDDLHLSPVTRTSATDVSACAMGRIANHSAPHLVHAARPIFPAQPTPDFSKRTVCRQYGTRNAVCSRPEGYIKREHVLRFTLDDGKQFLVQLSSKSEMISWLQCISVAAPLALDIDERPMPEPAYYPRTRRRALELTGFVPRRPRTAPAALESASSQVAPPARDGTAASQVSDADEVEEDLEEALDHLPTPPRRPPMIRNLSSVDHARRMGIQL